MSLHGRNDVNIVADKTKVKKFEFTDQGIMLPQQDWGRCKFLGRLGFSQSFENFPVLIGSCITALI